MTDAWVFIEDELPSLNTDVLVAVKGQNVNYIDIDMRVKHYDKERFFYNAGKVTHWMPLPELPKDKGETQPLDELARMAQEDGDYEA